MPHIHLDNDLPGIRGLFAFSPATAAPMSALAQVLLHDENTLSRADRELIATYVSYQNDCRYCQTSHGALAAYHLIGDEELVRQVKQNFETAPISAKREERGGRRHRARATPWCDRPGDSRYGTHCRRILYVQPLCGWSRDVCARRH